MRIIGLVLGLIISALMFVKFGLASNGRGEVAFGQNPSLQNQSSYLIDTKAVHK